MPTTVPAEIAQALAAAGLIPAGQPLVGEPMTGGVSSDIWRVDLPAGAVCVKRALGRLRVAADWEVPVERNAFEVAWMRVAAGVIPQAVPQVLWHDAQAGMFVMNCLDPRTHRLWKHELRDGQIDVAVAAAVGRLLAMVHAATAGRADIAARFRTDDLFHALRLAPYLEATAARHPDLADALRGLVRRTAGIHQALVHGDVSPKNILVGPAGPVFLDAECAWYGDPAFDLAFCLNHLLLKGVWRPARVSAYLQCFHALRDAYAQGVTWTSWDELEARAAQLLPGLLLARIDGKSPVEYITEAHDQQRVRVLARRFLVTPPARLSSVSDAWAMEWA